LAIELSASAVTVTTFTRLRQSGLTVLHVAAAIPAVRRHSQDIWSLPIDLLLSSCEISSIRVTAIPSLDLSIEVRILLLHLRPLSGLSILTLLLLSAIERRHLPLRLSRLLPNRLPVRTLGLTVPLRLLTLHLRHLSLHLRELPLGLPVHLRHLPLHLRHLTLHLGHRPLGLLSHLRLLSLHLRHRPLSLLPHLWLLPLHLRLATAASTITAAVTVSFALRVDITKTAKGENQQYRK
jgi:hypothetical protein